MFLKNLLLCFTSFAYLAAFWINPSWAFQKYAPEWFVLNETYIGSFDEDPPVYKTLNHLPCEFDQLENMVCVEGAWRNSCFEFFAIFSLSDEIPYILKKADIPTLQVNSFEEHDLKVIPYLEQEIGHLIPKIIDKDLVIWRVQIGSLEDVETAENGIFYQLMNGENLTTYFTLQNETVMRSRVQLETLKPLLKKMLSLASDMKPPGDCAA